MSALKEILTENEIIDSIEMNDSTVEVTSIVTKLIAKSKANNGAMVCRLVISNGQGRFLQLVAWHQNIKTLDKVNLALNQVITVERATSKAVSKFSKFNDGNVDFELIINPNTTIVIEGTLNDSICTTNSEAMTANLENLMNFPGRIKIQGYIKNNFNQLISKNSNKGIGSITNGEKKLEIQIIKYDDHEFQKGQLISVIGEVLAKESYSPYLRVEKISDIVLIDDEPKVSIEFLLNGYRYVE